MQSASGIDKNYLYASQGPVSEFMLAKHNCAKPKEVPRCFSFGLLFVVFLSL